jgi:hypothetical protein
LIHAVVWNKCALTIARQSIRWNGQNMRWETSPLDVSRGAGMIGVPVPAARGGTAFGTGEIRQGATLLFPVARPDAPWASIFAIEIPAPSGSPAAGQRQGRHRADGGCRGGRGSVGAKPFEGGTRRRVRRRGLCGASPVCPGCGGSGNHRAMKKAAGSPPPFVDLTFRCVDNS